MAEYIEREGLMQFPIRREHCDKEHANEHFYQWNRNGAVRIVARKWMEGRFND